MQGSFLEKFRRITSSGFYLPQVDGLRFVAIFMVVCVAHIPNFLNQKLFGGELITGYWSAFSLDGVFGVQFFFIISGFVLGHAFARKHFNHQKSDLKSYYFRRLTRMEPPYLLALILFFIALIFITRKYAFSELLPHFLASFFYLHNEIYQQHSWVMPVAWTLEIEIQFYLAAPLLGLIYKIPGNKIRWIVFCLLIIGDAAYWYNIWHGMHLVKYLHYFLCGMLMADLYEQKIKFPGNKKLGFYAGLSACFLLPFVIGYSSLAGYFIKYLLMIILFYTALTNEKLSRLFSVPFIAITGGMCYSIYLIHEQVISAAWRGIMLLNLGRGVLQFWMFYILLTLIVVLASAAYFKWVEQPCMRRSWWKRFLPAKKNG